jgi:hypothetical protein
LPSPYVKISFLFPLGIASFIEALLMYNVITQFASVTSNKINAYTKVKDEK